MKEIDFLPEWFKSGQRRQVSYRTQYIALGGVLLMMIVWNFIATRSISNARAQFGQMATRQAEAEGLSAELVLLKSELNEFQKKTEFIEEIDSKIDVASVLAEMSFLIDKNIVLSKVVFVAEKLEDKQQAEPSPRAANVVRAVQIKHSEKQRLPLGDVRFKLTLSGVAAEAGDVAALICKLEDSPYFCQVVPSFSKTAEINTANSVSLSSGQKRTNARDSALQDGGNIRVSEFEISCYLANYQVQ